MPLAYDSHGEYLRVRLAVLLEFAVHGALGEDDIAEAEGFDDLRAILVGAQRTRLLEGNGAGRDGGATSGVLDCGEDANDEEERNG